MTLGMFDTSGYVLLPREATGRMLDAAVEQHGETEGFGLRQQLELIYGAFVYAAPPVSLRDDGTVWVGSESSPSQSQPCANGTLPVLTADPSTSMEGGDR
jgi:hypothetical protein